jgi:hypothetical protein
VTALRPAPARWDSRPSATFPALAPENTRPGTRHRTLVITRKGGKVVTIPLASRTARAIDLSVAELAMRASLTGDDIERIEEGGTEPTIPLLRRLAAALNAGARLTGGHDLGSVWFETHAA